jgi:hypothetical protein
VKNSSKRLVLAQAHNKALLRLEFVADAKANSIKDESIILPDGPAGVDHQFPRNTAWVILIQARTDIAKTDRARGDDLYRGCPVRQVRNGISSHVGYGDLTDRKIVESDVGITVTYSDARHFHVVGFQAIARTVSPRDRDTRMNVGQIDIDAIAMAIATILAWISRD